MCLFFLCMCVVWEDGLWNEWIVFALTHLISVLQNGNLNETRPKRIPYNFLSENKWRTITAFASYLNLIVFRSFSEMQNLKR